LTQIGSGQENHFTKILIERPFDRNIIWPNTNWPYTVWPKVHSTESPFNWTPFDRKFILPKGHMTDFFQKMVIWANLLSTKNVMCPKKNCAQGRLTENSFDQKFICPKAFYEYDHLTESSSDQNFFSKKYHLTDCSYSIRIVHQPNFFVAARHHERFFFPILSWLLFQSYREYD
jgi:hypothetical protein